MNAGEMLSAAVGLLWRGDCICCGRMVSRETGVLAAGSAVGPQLCQDCGWELQGSWTRVSPPVSVVPVYAAGSYGGVHRALILAMKEHLRPAALKIGARVVESGMLQLAAAGVVGDPRWTTVVLLPAPSRRKAARARGGDLVSRLCALVAHRWQRVHAIDVAYLEDSARDSVGLGRAERRANIAAHIHLEHRALQRVRELRDATVVVIDDVCTTGATSAQFTLALRAAGIAPSAVLVLGAA
ncbi:hypothetical protein CUROG_08010 [Corynebacterium urogenitale]|uniref:ComF family protein n=2 Tax=Corynebacterium urogenitale TaxID=2487892 RepID=A0A5J6ZDH4_9CORY|nr:hypothetical protein CUROG_08010 [Corynebacterium urogenitale]